MTADADDAPFDLSLLPRSATVDERGHCAVAGVDLTQIAEEFGTPLYVYDEGELRARCREYSATFPDGVAYASKAFLCSAMALLVADEGLLIDVATGGELHIALSAGVPADRIAFHGNNKSERELRRALADGVGRIIVDSFDELDRLEALVSEGLPAPTLQVRVTPGIEADTHAHIATGTDDSKFGLSLVQGDALAAVRRVVAHPQFRFAGIHCHIGSQIFDMHAFDGAVERMAGFVRTIEDVCDTSVDELNVGGGLGVRYLSGDHPPSIAEFGAAINDGVGKALADAGARSRPRLMVEPGRSIAGPSGLTLYRVGTIKTIKNVRTYVAVDGGMSDNLRPVAYGATYEAFLPARASAPRPLVASVAGKHCEQGDVMVRAAHLPGDVAVGDVLAMPVTGAYGHSLASNYNKVPRPAVVFVHDGRARVVQRRETDDDLLRLDEP